MLFVVVVVQNSIVFFKKVIFFRKIIISYEIQLLVSRFCQKHFVFKYFHMYFSQH